MAVAAGVLVAVLAGWLSRRTGGREDSQLAGVYLVACNVSGHYANGMWRVITVK